MIKLADISLFERLQGQVCNSLSDITVFNEMEFAQRFVERYFDSNKPVGFDLRLALERAALGLIKSPTDFYGREVMRNPRTLRILREDLGDFLGDTWGEGKSGCTREEFVAALVENLGGNVQSYIDGVGSDENVSSWIDTHLVAPIWDEAVRVGEEIKARLIPEIERMERHQAHMEYKREIAEVEGWGRDEDDDYGHYNDYDNDYDDDDYDEE